MDFNVNMYALNIPQKYLQNDFKVVPFIALVSYNLNVLFHLKKYSWCANVNSKLETEVYPNKPFLDVCEK